MSHTSLRLSYTWLAPIYNLFLRGATHTCRRDSLAHIPAGAGWRVLLPGVGTGLDCPWLPSGNSYFGLDITHAMLQRIPCSQIGRIEGDSQRLPFADESFDAVVLHLILAVSPQPETCLHEALRVLKPGGMLLIFDKFLQPGRPAPLRRWLTPLTAPLATRMDVELEALLQTCNNLLIHSDEPALLGGWFRRIRLEKTLT